MSTNNINKELADDNPTLSIPKILYTALFIGTAVIFSIAGFTVWQNNIISSLTSSMHEHQFIVVNNVRDIRVDVRSLWEITTKATYQNIYLDDTPKQMQDIENKIDKEYMNVKSQYLGPQSNVEEINSSYEKFKYIIHQTLEIRNKQGAKEAAKYLEENHGEQKYKQISNKINDVITFAQNKANELNKQSIELHKNGTQNIFIFSMLMLVAGVIAALALMRYIRKEFSIIETLVENIKNDNYQSNTTYTNSLQEFSSLSEVLTKMADEISVKNQEILTKNNFLMEQARSLEETNVELDSSYEEARRTNAMMERQQKKYKSILSSATDGIHILDINGNIVEFSDSFANMLGYTNQEVYSLKITDIDAAIPKEKIHEMIRSLMNSSAIFETKQRKKDDSIIDVEINVRGINIDGKSYLYASARDITEKKEYEEQRELLLSSLGDGVYGIDTQGICTFINKSALEMIGFDEGEVIGFNQHDLFHHHYKDDKFYPEEDCPIYKTTVDGVTRDIEDMFIRKSGEHFDVHIKVAPIIKSDKITGAVVVFQDIRQRKELEENMESINKYLHKKVKEETEKRLEKEHLLIQQSKLASMGEMISNIAHHWRQPLNMLAIDVQDVEMAYDANELDKEYLHKFKETSMATIKNMSKTIDNFKGLYSPDSEKENFYIKEAIHSAVSIVQENLQSLNIRTEIIEPKDDIEFYGYKNELSQVVVNILNNSKDILSSKHDMGEAGMIKIGITKNEESLKISLTDNGGGIPNDIIERVFEPYFTTKYKAQGVGLSLYISKLIIEHDMNGKLSVHNIADGACFEIDLPL